MAEVIAVGAAASAGFGLIRRKPLNTLAWGLVLSLGLGVVVAAYAGFFVNMFSLTVSEPPGAQSPGQALAVIGTMLMSEGLVVLAFFIFFCVQTVVTTAVWRAVLHPGQGAWAYLRVGRAELFVVVMKFAVGLVVNLATFPLMPFLFIVGALLVGHHYVAAAIVGGVAVITFAAGIIYLQLRFALLGPMIVDDGKFHFVDAWRLTRGSVGRLLLTGLCVFGFALAIEVVIEALAFVSGAAALGVATGGFDKLQAFFEQPPPVIAGKLWPLAAIWSLAAVLMAGPVTAVMAAPWAKAYRDLAPANLRSASDNLA